jgi:protein-histidine pros-kinase
LAHDITEIKKIRNKKFKGLLESAPDSIVIVNESGKIVLVNSQTEIIFGYPRNELIGMDVELLMPQRFKGNHASHREHYFPVTQDKRDGSRSGTFCRRKRWFGVSGRKSA